MRTGAKMLLIKDRMGDRPENRNGKRYGKIEYGVENNYDNGMRMDMDEMESRRRRDSRGRFRSAWDDDMWDAGRYSPKSRGYDGESYGRMGGYPNRPFPVYERGGDMNQIGFNANREIETNYRMNAGYEPTGEMEHRTGMKMGGGASSNMSMPMTHEMAEEWTSGMKNEDGTRGPHWKMDQVKQLMKQKGIDCDPLEMYAVINALYSDYCAVLKKHGVNNMDVYIDLACAWLNDRDAVPNKASAYYEHIVKK